MKALLYERLYQLSLLGFLMLGPSAALADTPTVKLHRLSVVRFASVAEGKAALARKDHFLTSLSRFDRQSRLQTDEKVSQEKFVGFITKEVIAWNEEDIKQVRTAVASIHERLRSFNIPFPKTVLLVKTTGREEGGAAYCRGNAIVLPTRMLARANRLEQLLIHELFHILSSHNAELRNRLYAIIGFQPCSRVPFPKTLVDRKLTNPDSPVIEHYIRIDRDGAKVDVTPILFASVESYDPKKGGTFFRYVVFKLMVLEAKGKTRVPRLKDGEPILLTPTDEASFMKQIGGNTGYIIHPDETLADNFVFMATKKKNLKTPRIVEEMRVVFDGKKE